VAPDHEPRLLGVVLGDGVAELGHRTYVRIAVNVGNLRAGVPDADPFGGMPVAIVLSVGSKTAILVGLALVVVVILVALVNVRGPR
jgi:hypothetical protein